VRWAGFLRFVRFLLFVGFLRFASFLLFVGFLRFVRFVAVTLPMSTRLV
jgi:hypothetical protein